MITKRRRTNFFERTDSGKYFFTTGGDWEIPDLGLVIDLFDPPEPGFNEPQQDIQDKDLLALLQEADAMEPINIKVPEGSTLDHHHDSLEQGFHAPGAMRTSRGMQIALERHMEDGDFAEHHEHL